MSIRDLVVSIDFDDIDIKKLLKVDTAMDEIEDGFSKMDKDISIISGDFDKVGNRGSDAMGEIKTEAKQAGDAMNSMGDDAKKAGSEAETTTEKTGDAMDDFGDKAKKSGKKAKDAMDEVGDEAEDTEEKVKSAGDGFGSFGKAAVGAVAAVGLAIGGLVMSIGLLTNETETAFDRLQAKTATTGAEFEGIKSVAEDVFAGAFGESIGQVSDDVARLRGMFGDLTNKELKNVAEGAYTISDLWGEPVENIGVAIKNMTSNFKDLSESDAMDLITVAFQKTGDYSQDLLDTFREYSPYFAKMGLSAEEFTGILIRGAEEGAWNLDKVGDAVKEIGIRSMDNSKLTNEAFTALGLDAQKMGQDFAAGGDTANNAFMATIAALSQVDDKVKQNEMGVALFGTQWEDLGADVVLAMGDASGAVGDFQGATDAAAQTAYDNFGTRMTGVFRELKLKIADAFSDNGGEQLLSDIATKAEELVPKIEALVGKAVEFAGSVQDNWPAIRETTIGIATAVGVFVGTMKALSIIATINTLIGAYRAGTLVATAAQLGLNLAMWASPVTWVVAGIALLVAAGVALYRNWDTVKQKTGELWQKLLDNPLLALAAGPIGGLIAAGIALYKNWDTVKEKAGLLWSVVKVIFGSIYDWGASKIGGVKSYFQGLVDKFNDFKSAISSFKLPGWVNSIGSTLSSAARKVGGLFDGSHATGLERVPFDGYAAELHKDEAVLTANQADALRNTGMLDSVGGRPQLNLTPNETTRGRELQPTTINREIGSTTNNRNTQTTNNTFAPVIKVTVERGQNGEMDETVVAQAVKRELEKFWISMNLKEA